MVIDEAPDVLEDDDVLEMVNAGLAPITVVDDYLAEFWSKVFTDIKVHQDVAVRSGGSLAVAFRKENPKLREVVNTWIRKHGKGDAFRNTIERRYLENVKYAKNAAADAERQKFRGMPPGPAPWFPVSSLSACTSYASGSRRSSAAWRRTPRSSREGSGRGSTARPDLGETRRAQPAGTLSTNFRIFRPDPP